MFWKHNKAQIARKYPMSSFRHYLLYNLILQIGQISPLLWKCKQGKAVIVIIIHSCRTNEFYDSNLEWTICNKQTKKQTCKQTIKQRNKQINKQTSKQTSKQTFAAVVAKSPSELFFGTSSGRIGSTSSRLPQWYFDCYI